MIWHFFDLHCSASAIPWSAVAGEYSGFSLAVVISQSKLLGRSCTGRVRAAAADVLLFRCLSASEETNDG